MENNVRKKTLIAIILIAVVVVSAAVILLCVFLRPKVAHIVVIAGQSNCEGVSGCDFLEEYVTTDKYERYKTGINNVKIRLNTNGLFENEFVPCKLGQGTSEKYFGIELGIADSLSERYPNEEFYIIKRAHGGTSIFPFWHAPGEDGYGMYFTALCETVDKAIADLKNQGKTVVVEAFCWMQGETDATDASNVQTYYHYLESLVAYFRARYAQYNKNTIRFVDAGISKYDLAEPYYYREINEIKQRFSSTSDFNFYIDTIEMGLTLHLEPKEIPDLIHYDSFSMLRLGQAFGKYAYSK